MKRVAEMDPEFDDMAEEQFVEICRDDPARVFRYTSAVMEHGCRLNLVTRANSANLNRLSHALAQVTSLEDEMDFLREEGGGTNSVSGEDAAKLRADLKKRTKLVDAYKSLLRERDEKAREEISRLKKLVGDAPVRGREPRRISLSAMTRELLDEQRATLDFGADFGAGSPSPPSLSPLQDTKRDEPARSASHFTDPRLESIMKTDKGVPNPAQCTGQAKDYGIYEFIRSLEPKLKATTFRTDEDGLQYVLALLKGPDWKLCAARVPSTMAGRRCHNPFKSVEETISELTDRFGQVNHEGDAWTALRQLRQGPAQTFGNFYIRYMEFRSQIPYLSDAQEMDMLEGKLNETYLGQSLGR